MCRRAIDGLCLVTGAKGRNLEKKIQDLRNRQLIDDRLHEWMTELRLFGNAAVHELEMVEATDAKDLLELTHATLEYVFSYGNKFEAFKQRRAEKATQRATGGADAGDP